MREPIARFEKVSYEQFKKDWIKTFKLEGELFDDTGIKFVWDNIELPKRKTKGSAGYDINIPYDITVGIGSQHIIPTGLRCCMNDEWVMLIYPRSSKGIKLGMFLNNHCGVIDSDFFYANNEGHIMLSIQSNSHTLSFHQNEALAQALFIPYGIAEENEVGNIRKGGIGSTDGN